MKRLLKYLKPHKWVMTAATVLVLFIIVVELYRPIIIGDALGQNYAIEKVKGRRVSLERIAERMKEQYLDVPHQKVIIAHADCYDEAVEFKNIICKTLGKELDITIDYVGPCTGSATGPGMLCVYYFGKEVLVNKEN